MEDHNDARGGGVKVECCILEQDSGGKEWRRKDERGHAENLA